MSTSAKKWPVLRIVTTSRCNLRCHYCPPDNEDYPSSVIGKGGPKNIDWVKLRTFVPIGLDQGITRVSLTGGEPLLSADPVDLICDMAAHNPHVHWVVQTNGVYLRQYIQRLATIKKLTLKISLDVFDRDAFKAMCGQDEFLEVVAAIKEARQHRIHVGVNTVLTKDALKYVKDLVKFAKENDCYIKFLDLNWYVDVGARAKALPMADEYWERYYVNPQTELMPILKEQGIDGFQISRNHTYGIPVSDSNKVGDFFVRVKDSSFGTVYSASTCLNCEHFHSRKCQEGVYELTLTPDFRLKICRHRPDIEYSVDPVKMSAEEIAGTLQNVFMKVYNDARHYDLEAGSRYENK